MATIGTVTRTMGDTYANSTQTFQGNRGAFVARNAAGVTIGFFRSAAGAQAAVSAGHGILLRWTRKDLRGDIEQYIGDDGS